VSKQGQGPRAWPWHPGCDKACSLPAMHASTALLRRLCSAPLQPHPSGVGPALHDTPAVPRRPADKAEGAGGGQRTPGRCSNQGVHSQRTPAHQPVLLAVSFGGMHRFSTDGSYMHMHISGMSPLFAGYPGMLQCCCCPPRPALNLLVTPCSWAWTSTCECCPSACVTGADRRQSRWAARQQAQHP
jgi:hypothetical protein